MIGKPSPHGNCEPSEDYVQSKCLAECQANYVISNCSCRTVSMPGETSKYVCLLSQTILCFTKYLLVNKVFQMHVFKLSF